MSENLAKMAHDFFCDYRQTRDFVLRNDAVQASKDMDSIVAALKRPTDDKVQKLVEAVKTATEQSILQDSITQQILIEALKPFMEAL